MIMVAFCLVLETLIPFTVPFRLESWQPEKTKKHPDR